MLEGRDIDGLWATLKQDIFQSKGSQGRDDQRKFSAFDVPHRPKKDLSQLLHIPTTFPVEGRAFGT